MSAERKLSDQDYERLSAYLDGALSADEQSALEARLAGEPELRRELDALRQTVQLLRALPVLKPPRDFTLTPAMVQPARWLVFPTSAAFSALSAAAAFLLAVGALALWMSVGAAQPTGVQTREARGDMSQATTFISPTEGLAPDGAAEVDVLSATAAPVESEQGQEAGAGLADSPPPEAALASVPQPPGSPSPEAMLFAAQPTPSPMDTLEPLAPLAAAAEVVIEPSITPGVERAALTAIPTDTLAPSETPASQPTPTAPMTPTAFPAPQMASDRAATLFDLLPILLLLGASALVIIAVGTTWARRARR